MLSLIPFFLPLSSAMDVDFEPHIVSPPFDYLNCSDTTPECLALAEQQIEEAKKKVKQLPDVQGFCQNQLKQMGGFTSATSSVWVSETTPMVGDNFGHPGKVVYMVKLSVTCSFS